MDEVGSSNLPSPTTNFSKFSFQKGLRVKSKPFFRFLPIQIVMTLLSKVHQLGVWMVSLQGEHHAAK